MIFRFNIITRTNPWPVAIVVCLLAIHALVIVTGVTLFANGVPGLLLAEVAALTVVGPLLKVTAAMMVPARAFEMRKVAPGSSRTHR